MHAFKLLVSPSHSHLSVVDSSSHATHDTAHIVSQDALKESSFNVLHHSLTDRLQPSIDASQPSPFLANSEQGIVDPPIMLAVDTQGGSAHSILHDPNALESPNQSIDLEYMSTQAQKHTLPVESFLDHSQHPDSSSIGDSTSAVPPQSITFFSNARDLSLSGGSYYNASNIHIQNISTSVKGSEGKHYQPIAIISFTSHCCW